MPTKILFRSSHPKKGVAPSRHVNTVVVVASCFLPTIHQSRSTSGSAESCIYIVGQRSMREEKEVIWRLEKTA
jgi:hypothetical protein